VKSHIGKGITLNLAWMIILFALTGAFGEDPLRLQGLIMGLNLEKNRMTVNERGFVWDEKTMFYNDKGSLIAIDKFKPNSWVYIEAERVKGNNQVMITKIYLLPKRIDSKQRSRYPFME